MEGDIHTHNQEAAGLPTRDDAKTFIYAFMYGAGDEKLGSIVTPLASPSAQRRRGSALRTRFLKALPALRRLTEDIKRVLTGPNKRSWLIGLDGRRLAVRSSHAALNTLLQSAGAVVMKKATVIFHQECAAKGWVLGREYVQVLHVHDEFQCLTRPDLAEELGETLVNAIRLAGRHFGLNCPLDGEYKSGPTWAQTH